MRKILGNTFLLIKRGKFDWNNLCSMSTKFPKMATYEKISEQNFDKFIQSFDTILTDCDGVLWNGPDAIEGAPEAFTKFKLLGKRIFPITNNSTKTRSEYVSKCKSLGFQVDEEDIIGSAYVTAQYLKDDLKYEGKIFLVGSQGLYQELTAVGYEVEGMDVGCHNHGLKDLPNVKDMANMKLDPEIKCVVVGFDGLFNYTKLAMASSYLQVPGSLFVVTNTDSALPMGGGKILPGTGSIVSAVITAAHREPTIICGKPNHPIYDIAHEKHSVNKETTIMIGDRLNTDIELAHNCGLKGLHVLTGFHTEADVRKLQSSNSIQDQKQIPHYYIDSFGCFGNLIDRYQSSS